MKNYMILPLFLVSFLAEGREEILFERGRNSNLRSLFHEVSAHRTNPPRFTINREGLLTYKGDGDFGLLYTKKQYRNFIFDLRIRVPAGHFQYANSGVFFRFKDPKKMQDPSIPYAVREEAMRRTPGMIAEWSGYEVQLMAGVIPGDPTNKQNGSFYGVHRSNEYIFNPGETYDIRLVVKGQKFEVYMKWVNEGRYSLVSTLINRSRQKSYLPGHIGIQSYYSNGRDVKAIEFERLTITALP